MSIIVTTTTTIALLVSVQLSPEQIFWDCDYAGTSYMMGSSTAGLCSTNFEKLYIEKFNGKWVDFHNWWLKNKEKEHNIRKNKEKTNSHSG